MNPTTYHIPIGQFDCYALSDGSGAVGFEQFCNRFPSVPPTDLRDALEGIGESTETVDSFINPLLIRSADNIILVDSGLRNDLVATAGQTPDCLKSLGIAPTDVDTVIITHAHGDHIAGFFEADNETLRYPNARYWIHPQEWAFWTDADNLEQRGLTQALNTTRPWLMRLESAINMIDIEQPILPGITAIPAYGHTVGHICLLIESDGQRLVHGVDLVHSLIQFPHPEWTIHFDTDADAARATRLELFDWLVKEQLTTLFYHMPFPGVGIVEHADNGYRWQPRTI